MLCIYTRVGITKHRKSIMSSGLYIFFIFLSDTCDGYIIILIWKARTIPLGLCQCWFWQKDIILRD